MGPAMDEVFALDLDEELLCHLSISESIHELREEKFKVDLIEDDFIEKVYVWQMKHLSDHGRPATPSVLVDEFDIDIQEPLTAIGDLVDRLRERYIRNHVRDHMEEITDAYKQDPAKVIEVLPKVSRDIQSILGQRERSIGTGDYDIAMSHYDKMVLAGPGGSFGFEEIDHHYHGMKGITVCCAGPKTYKSWFTVNAVVENVQQGKHVWLYPLELPADETDMRVRCLAAGVPYWKYLRGALSEEDRYVLKEASSIIDGMGTYRCVQPPQGHRSIQEMIERAQDGGADAIFIDQLQYVEDSRGTQLGAGDHKNYWEVLNSARDYSDQTPLWLVHQFNRTIMGADKMPEMQQLKGAAAIEETATLVLGLWANKDMRKSNLIELGALASRNYTFKSWEIGVELSRSCDFQLLGEAVHDE